MSDLDVTKLISPPCACMCAREERLIPLSADVATGAAVAAADAVSNELELVLMGALGAEALCW